MATLLRVAYDGTEFHGFARQVGDGAAIRTVQGELDEALSRIYKQPISTRGASRTDAGVHARGQLVAFDPPFAIPARGLLLGLASKLPVDLIASAAWEADDVGGEPLNPRFHNLGKRYHYRVRCTPLRDPVTARFEWHLPRPITIEPVREAAARMVGEHDFAGFRASDCQAKTTVRRVRAIDVRVRPAREVSPLGVLDRGGLAEAEGLGVIEIEVRGDAFLKNMVRVMVGTMIGVGRGRFTPERVDEILAVGDRKLAGVTAPAQGLTLLEVLWPEIWPPLH